MLQDCIGAIVFRDMPDNHGGDHDRFPKLVSPRLKEIIAHGRKTDATAYRDALESAAYYRDHIAELLHSRSNILVPTTDGVAPPFSDLAGSQMLQSLWSITGMPTMAVPCGYDEGLPSGVQLMAAHYRETSCSVYMRCCRG